MPRAQSRSVARTIAAVVGLSTVGLVCAAAVAPTPDLTVVVASGVPTVESTLEADSVTAAELAPDRDLLVVPPPPERPVAAARPGPRGGSGTSRQEALEKVPDEAIVAQSASPKQWWETEPASGPSPVGLLGIPQRALDAYRAAGDIGSLCLLDWSVIAGIGRVESNHADGGRLLGDGRTFRPILGPVLNGGAFAAIPDSDNGQLDGHTRWDRAVGPMQFIPGTWAWMGVDADGDGRADPHDIDDAAAATALYLCRSSPDLSQLDALAEALLTYNKSRAYVASVVSWAHAYSARSAVVAGAPVPDWAESAPTTPRLPDPVVAPERPDQSGPRRGPSPPA